jgi:hypothetical protein
MKMSGSHLWKCGRGSRGCFVGVGVGRGGGIMLYLAKLSMHVASSWSSRIVAGRYMGPCVVLMFLCLCLMFMFYDLYFMFLYVVLMFLCLCLWLSVWRT